MYRYSEGRLEIDKLNMLELKGLQRVLTRELFGTSDFGYQDEINARFASAAKRISNMEQEDRKTGRRRWNLLELLEGL